MNKKKQQKETETIDLCRVIDERGEQNMELELDISIAEPILQLGSLKMKLLAPIINHLPQA